MRTILGTLLVATVAVAGLAAQSQPAPRPVDITGKWTMTLEREGGSSTPSLELKQEGEKLSGLYIGYYGKFPITGTVKARAVEFSLKMNIDGTEVAMSFGGEIAADGQTMGGRADLGGMGEASWSARRQPVK